MNDLCKSIVQETEQIKMEVLVTVRKQNVTRKKCLALWIDSKNYALELLYKKSPARQLAV